jgi:hypothetical protein
MPAQDYLTCVDNLKARKLPAGRVQAMLGDVDKFGNQTYSKVRETGKAS